MVRERKAPETKKPCARLPDTDHNRRSCHGPYISDGIHPFERSRASCPIQRPDCCWTILRMIVFQNSKVWLSENHAKARATGARVLFRYQRRMLCFSSNAL